MLKRNCKQAGVILTALGIFTLVSSLAYAADESATELTKTPEEQLLDPETAAKYEALKKLKENLASAEQGSAEDQEKASEEIKTLEAEIKESLSKEDLEGKMDEEKMKEIEAMIKESIPADKEMGERPSDKDIERMREEFEKNMEREPLNPDKEMFREPPNEGQIKEFEKPELPPIEQPKEEPK